MAFYLKKSSILLPYLDDIILRVAQAGLMQVWEYNVRFYCSEIRTSPDIYIIFRQLQDTQTQRFRK